MSKLDDLIQGVKNMPNDNFEYDKQKFKDLMLELLDSSRWTAKDDVYTENRRQRDYVLDELCKKVVEL